MAYQRIMFTSRYINEWVDHVEDYALGGTDIESEEGQNQAREKWMDRFLDIYDILNRSVTKIAAEFESDAVAMAVVYRAGVLENAFVGEALRHLAHGRDSRKRAVQRQLMPPPDHALQLGVHPGAVDVVARPTGHRVSRSAGSRRAAGTRGHPTGSTCS